MRFRPQPVVFCLILIFGSPSSKGSHPFVCVTLLNNPSELALLLLFHSFGLMQSPSLLFLPLLPAFSRLFSTSLLPSFSFQKILNTQPFYASREEEASLSLILQPSLIGFKPFQTLPESCDSLLQIVKAKPIGLSLFTIVNGLNSCYSRAVTLALLQFSHDIHKSTLRCGYSQPHWNPWTFVWWGPWPRACSVFRALCAPLVVPYQG